VGKPLKAFSALSVGTEMFIQKTVKVPVHYDTTKSKLQALDKLTARLTYAVLLWSELIDQRNIRTRKELQNLKHQRLVQNVTGLSARFVQQCGNKALWMWESYRKSYERWKKTVEKAKTKEDEQKLHKQLKREPSKPFHGRSSSRKIPTRFDYRTGEVQRSRQAKLSPLLIRISTLKKYEKLTVFLNPSNYHLELLERGEIRDFQLVKHGGKYYAHIVVRYEVEEQPIQAIRGVDLGIRRGAATVSLHPGRPLRREDFSVIEDGLKKQRLNRLNERVAELQRAGKWKALKRMRGKRRRVAEYYDRLMAKRIAEISEGCLVVVGYPKGIKADNYRGNGKRALRRGLAQWSYGLIIRYITEECAEKGIKVIEANERWSSMTCNRCGSRNISRPRQSTIYCCSCGLTYDADFNAAINIGSNFWARPGADGMQMSHPELRMNWLEKPRSAEAASF
jgi:IS605 OrfB family transposase